MNDTRRHIPVLIGVIALFFITLKTHRTYAGDGDEPHYLLVAESLLSDHDLNVSNQYPDGHVDMPQITELRHTVPNLSGGRYPVHDVGLSFFLLPGLWLAHHLNAYMPAQVYSILRMTPEKLTITVLVYQSIGITAILAILMLKLFENEEWSLRWNYWAVLIAIVTLPIASQAYLYFTEIYSAVFIVWALLLLDRPTSPWMTSLYCFLLVCLCWLHARNWPIAAAFSFLWLIQRKSLLKRLIPGCCVFASVAGRLVMNWHYIGKLAFSVIGQLSGNEHMFGLKYIPTVLLALIFDRQYGLVWMNPLFFLLPSGIYILTTEHHPWIRREAVIVVCYLALIAVFRDWIGGWCPAGRFLVPIAPLLWLPVLKATHELRGKFGKALSSFLGLFACLIAYLHWNNPRLFWMNPDGLNPWMHVLSTNNHDWQKLLPSFVQNELVFTRSLVCCGILMLLITMTVVRNCQYQNTPTK